MYDGKPTLKPLILLLICFLVVFGAAWFFGGDGFSSGEKTIIALEIIRLIFGA